MKKFGNPANTLVHLRVHTQEKTYKCTICPSAFCDSSTLKKHLRTHTGEKPYACTFCEKKFSQSGNLKRHLTVHEKYDIVQSPITSASQIHFNGYPFVNYTNNQQQDSNDTTDITKTFSFKKSI